MEANVARKLITFFQEYGENFDAELKHFIITRLDDFLEGGTHMDVLGQVAAAIGETPFGGDLYKQFFKFLKENYDLTGDVLEVGCGFYPALATIIDDYQREQGKGTIEVYDPEIIVSEKGTIRINKANFDSRTSIDRFSLVTAMFPCDITKEIIQRANSEDKDFAVLMCKCVPNKGSFWGFLKTSEEWQSEVYELAKETVKPGRIIDMDYVPKASTPIIYSKRKKH